MQQKHRAGNIFRKAHLYIELFICFVGLAFTLQQYYTAITFFSITFSRFITPLNSQHILECLIHLLLLPRSHDHPQQPESQHHLQKPYFPRVKSHSQQRLLLKSLEEFLI